MKLFSFLSVLMLLSGPAVAQTTGVAQYELSKSLNSGTAFKHDLGHAIGYVRAVWDPSGKSAVRTSTLDSGVHGLGAFLPKSAVVIRSWYDVKTAVTFSGADVASSTIAFQCEDSANLVAAVDLSAVSVDTPTDGAADDAIGNFVDDIAAECEIEVVVAGDNATAGKVNLFIEYVNSPD